MTAPRPWREVATGYDAGAATYDDRHGDPATRRRTTRIEAPLLAAVAGRARVLEVGVGTGRLLAQAATTARLAIGVDISAAMLAEAARKRLAVVRADGHHLPFAGASFDAILAGGGVYRYLDTDVALVEHARVLAPAGILAIHQFAANPLRLRGGARTPDPRVRELRHVDELLAPARAAGFDVVRVIRTRSLPVPPYVVEIPAWLDRASRRQIWSQIVVILRRRA
jgi:ubiquinone/menaquinone biosynthesis C-methylase UbiE